VGVETELALSRGTQGGHGGGEQKGEGMPRQPTRG